MSDKNEGSIDGLSNTNKGDNRSNFENVIVEGDLSNIQEISQEGKMSDGGTVVADPNSKNFWIDICERIASLPISEKKLLIPPLSIGSLGMLVFLWLVYPMNGLSIGGGRYQFAIILALVSAILVGFPLAYISTDKNSRCPECNERFALRTDTVRITDRTERDDQPDIIHGERDEQCRECGYEQTVPDKWNPNDFS